MIINGINYPGIQPGKGFKDALMAPIPVKEYATNESRLDHGKRVLSIPVKKQSRSLTLEFQITGSSQANFESTLNMFYSELNSGEFVVRLNLYPGPKYFHLIYTGKTSTYSGGLSGCSCKIKVSFDEPDPSNNTP